MLLRSMMFVPGHNRELLLKAKLSNADALIFDLEDSVPADKKLYARETLWSVLGDYPCTKPMFVRVNDRCSGELLRDLSLLAYWSITGFMYPKAESADDIVFFDRLLEAVECEKGITRGYFHIIPLIESCGAVLHVEEICRASKRVIAVAFGAEDYAADLGADSVHDARWWVPIAARACGVQAIDMVDTLRQDAVDLGCDCMDARYAGYAGKLVLSPKEIPTVHQHFSPSEQQVADAHEMIRLSEEAAAQGKGVAVFDGKFVGPPLVRAARKVLARQAAIEGRGR